MLTICYDEKKRILLHIRIAKIVDHIHYKNLKYFMIVHNIIAWIMMLISLEDGVVKDHFTKIVFF